MNKRLAYFLCRFAHYAELSVTLPVEGFHRTETIVEQDGYVSFSYLFLVTILFIFSPFAWVFCFIAVVGRRIWRIVGRIKLPEIRLPKFDKVYCPTKFPEKYEEGHR